MAGGPHGEAALSLTTPHLTPTRAVRTTGEASNQHGKDTGEEDAVERPGAPDRGDWSPQPLQSSQVQQVGAHQGADAATDIGQCCRISARQHQCGNRGCHCWNKHRHRDAKPTYG